MYLFKISIQKSGAFLCVNNELSERKIKKIPFTVASKGIKYLEINLTKDVKGLYLENYETLKKIQISGSTNRVHG